MVTVCIILGFLLGTSMGSSALVVALGGSRNAAFWSFVQRHPMAGSLAKLWSATLVAACGVMFAYLGYSLALWPEYHSVEGSHGSKTQLSAQLAPVVPE